MPTTNALEDIRAFLPLSDTLATAGQPTEAQLAAVGAAGYEVVVNLAPPTSSGALPDEAGVVQAHGMEYIALPIEWEAPTVEDTEKFFAVMDANAGRRVFVHCAANMRVSAFVYLYRTLRQTMPEADAARDLRRIWEPNERWRAFINEVKNTMTAAQQAKASGEEAASAAPPAAWSRDLAAASDAGDELAFVRAVRAVDWTERTEDDFETAVRLALMAGAHQAARVLADKGFSAFPESEMLRKMATILAPPRVIGVLPADPSVAANQQWMRSHWEEHRGCWIALRDGNLLAVAPSLREIEQQVGPVRNSGIFVTRIAG